MAYSTYDVIRWRALLLPTPTWMSWNATSFEKSFNASLSNENPSTEGPMIRRRCISLLWDLLVRKAPSGFFNASVLTDLKAFQSRRSSPLRCLRPGTVSTARKSPMSTVQKSDEIEDRAFVRLVNELRGFRYLGVTLANAKGTIFLSGAEYIDATTNLGV